MSRLCILGAGGHGRVLADAAEATKLWAQIVFYDDMYPACRKNGPWQVLGRANDLLSAAPEDAIVAIGRCTLRLALQQRLEAAGHRLVTVIHPSASVSRYAEIDKGTVVFAGACINIGARLGRAVIVNTGATVDHDCSIDDGVHIAPGAHIAGDVSIGERTWIGIGASVKQGISIGCDAVIGAGATVISEIPDGVTAVGVPARARQ